MTRPHAAAPPGRSARRALPLLPMLALAAPLAGCRAPDPLPWPRESVPMLAVDRPAAAPFSSICRLEVHRRQVNGLVVTEDAAVSTGALVDAGHLLTVAHNFASPPHTPVTRRLMACGRRGAHPAWARSRLFQGDELRVATDFEGAVADDYAVLLVGARAPFGSGFRLPRPGERTLVPGETVHVAGYALDGRAYDGRTLYHGAGRVRATSRDSTWFVYDVDTRGGMSGSPVWVVRRAPDGTAEYVIVGVHVGRNSIDGRLWAVARRIGGDALLNVQDWMTRPAGRAGL